MSSDGVQLDYEAAISDVDALRSAIETFNMLDNNPVRGLAVQMLEDTERRIVQTLPFVLRLAHEVGFSDTRRLRHWRLQGRSATAACDELIGELRSQKRRLEVIGQLTTSLSPRLHPWVWEEAASRWDAGQYRDAVQAAATRIFDVELPRKLDTKPVKDSADLLSAFNPKTGSAFGTLRFPGLTAGDPSYESVHRGAMLYGQGCVKGIRNPRTHRLANEEQVAIEELAALSLVARWIDEAAFTPPGVTAAG